MRPRGGLRRSLPPYLAAGLLVGLIGCSASSPAPLASPSEAAVSAAPTVGAGEVIPAPGSSSRLYAPNPAAIVVGIDPGHGGCLDWGVANPYDNTPDRSEKALTLGISLALRDVLEADGVTVVMTRTGDDALAGDLDPDLGCNGNPFRDVNGDGAAGFGPKVPAETRTRDELSAHIDLLNLARADVLLSIHINSLTDNGAVVQVAATETFWTDETPWGVPASERLATMVQDDVVQGLSAIAPYDRQDRGIDAVNYYIIAPASETGDPHEPRRGSLMPGVLAEVGSMSLEAEADLLATDTGQAAIAEALARALAGWFAARELGVRIDADVPNGVAGVVAPVEGTTGPPFWAPDLGDRGIGEGTLGLTLINTGTGAWPAGTQLLAGWEHTDEPYLARRPDLVPLDVAIPALEPGESVHLEVVLPQPPTGGRAVSWLTLGVGDQVLSDLGLPALQLAHGP
jgi:N-acetylmuramoyl-L-alanine amidase